MSKLLERAQSIELAVQKACMALEVSPEEIQYQVIQQPRKGILGLFGKRDAIIEVSVMEKESPAHLAQSFLEGVLERMKIPCQIETDSGTSEIRFNLKGEELAPLIGKQGRTLDALQTLVQAVVFQKHGYAARVTVDADGYRKRREKVIRELAKRMGDKVRKTKREITLAPMPASERKIVHQFVQQEEDLTTYSVGKEPKRCVVIAPKNKQ
ncbi:RNA-binding cell elongation regulator Jag/EloR [Thermoactinomyces mirandus]|uniref:RNA-binding protein KhpB n=1 Tax=Thermoactinomyces mirandus TaxID=2756294 RepID=A0A7W1XTC6_9BACL|nr:RNA-binding cell elongation regulator Jag/EloR [Thermoactinomyces mirandus]MBA4602865.1 protein jag [Thermoactinomyces mirandus]